MEYRSTFLFVFCVLLLSLTPYEMFAQCDYPLDTIQLAASVDQSQPYVGEQVIYTTEIYNTTVSAPVPIAPAFEGFWLAESLNIRKEDVPDCGGRVGLTIDEKILFPLATGELVIPPGRLDFSSNPVYEATTRILSNDVQVDVRPLPDNAPDGFLGTVGWGFELFATLDRMSVNVGDPIRLRIRVEGYTNVDQLDPPELPLDDTWKIYPQRARIENVEVRNRYLWGSKVFEWLIVPTSGGTFSLPPIAFHYFDPPMGLYQTQTVQTSQPFVLTVLGDVAIDNGASETILPVLLPDDEIMTWALKTQLQDNRQWQFILWFLSGILPLALFVGSIWWRWFLRWRVVYRSQRRQRQALHVARQRLGELRGKKYSDQVYRQLIEVMWSYFGDKWNREPLSLSKAELRVQLIEAEIDDTLIDAVLACLEDAEARRYAPDVHAGTPKQLVNRTLFVLRQVDQGLKA